MAGNVRRVTLPEPSERQNAALQVIRDAERGERVIIGWGGAVGGGKTSGIVIAAVMYMIENPGCRILIGRDELKSLKTTTMEQFYRLTPNEILYPNHQENYCDLVVGGFPEGVTSRVYFRGVHDSHQFRSEEYAAVFIDESDRIPEESAYVLLSRLRQRGPITPEHPRGQPYKWVFMAASNPNPGWFEDWFIRDKFPKDELAGYARIVFIPSKMDDNPFLDEGYKITLLKLLPEAMRKRFLEGSWDVIEGAIFDNLDPRVHCISQKALQSVDRTVFPVKEIEFRGKRMLIPEFRRAVGGLDFAGQGRNAHHSTGIVRLVLKDGRDIAALEFFDRGPQVFRRQKEWMRDVQRALRQKVAWYADKTQGTGIEELQQQGYTVDHNPGERDSWETEVRMIRDRLAHDIPNGEPPLSMYMDTCPNLEAQLRAYRFDMTPRADGSYKTRPIEKDDDMVAAYRYSGWAFRERAVDPKKFFGPVLKYVHDLRPGSGSGRMSTPPFKNLRTGW